MGNTAPKAEKKDAMVALGSLLKEMDLLHEPSSDVTSVAEAAAKVKIWLEPRKSKRVERRERCLASWVLRLKLHHEWMKACLNHYNVDVKDLELFLCDLLVQQCVVQKRKELHIYFAEGVDQENQFLGIRVRDGMAGSEGSKRCLERAREVVQYHVVESLACQVSSVLWSRARRSIYYGRTIARHNHSKRIDWGLFQQRLETHPEEAMYTEVVSTVRDKHPSILHAICGEKLGDDFLVPLDVLETMIRAYPKALSIKSQNFFGCRPLHHVLTGVAWGRSSFGIEHVQLMIAAYPEALSNYDEGEKVPIHWFFSFDEFSQIEDETRFSKARLDTIQACIKLILANIGDTCLLLSESTLISWASGYPYNKQSLHSDHLNKAIADSYLAFLRAIAVAQYGVSDEIDEWMLHIALDQKFCGSYVDILTDLLGYFHPSAFRKVNSGGSFPVHVAIQNHQEDGGNTYFDRIIQPIIRAEPRVLYCRETQHGLYPFALAAMGEKSESDKVYTLLRSDPTVLLSRESRQHT